MDIIDRLINYGISHNLIKERDRIFCKNQICSLIRQENPLDLPKAQEENDNVDLLLSPILELAVKNGVLSSTHPDYADFMDTAIMACLVPPPSIVQDKFDALYSKQGPDAATEYFYKLSIDSNYVRTNRIKKNYGWLSSTPCGNLEITINLSKPEKDSKAIALAKIQEEKEVKYPACFLCKENEGFSGNFSHPARQNLRIIEMDICGESWYFQYSPYIYYNEHSILLDSCHNPMKISQKTFERMAGFLEKYPSYFIGSNADLPIVGGSILSHDHYQAGRHSFPIDKAESFHKENFLGLDVELSILRWPVSVVRLRSSSQEEIIQAAVKIFDYWSQYSDESLEILAQTQENHNTVTPIARKKDGLYEFDLALRNNRTSAKHPLGIFHPHIEYHHIKKENIGLIEVMGLAILPGRLQEELALVKKHLIERSLKAAEGVACLNKHIPWMKEISKKHQITEENAGQIIRDEVASVFYNVLSNCGVFKEEEDFIKFLKKFVASF